MNAQVRASWNQQQASKNLHELEHPENRLFNVRKKIVKLL